MNVALAHVNTIYLGSKSPRRRELLKQIGVHYELLMMRESGNGERHADVDESPLPGEGAHAYVERIVRMKAAAAVRTLQARKLKVRPVLCADTTVTIDDAILGKPANAAEARTMLERLAGRTHEVLTAVAVSTPDDLHYACSASRVTFESLTESQMQRYLASQEFHDKAGGYAVQGLAAGFISRIEGSYSGIMGLPLFETTRLLRLAGIDL